ncbi:L,D-transpeptidase family protein [Streptomyces lushanensis]|uniref:L,D-transpeptidase family protein n=1 Tax=Streptomyces lushanensis TaxID=1434255 RepID=UPI00082E4966|nr:L,D-transpeptidase family protein [Streptomyces lushanensis]
MSVGSVRRGPRLAAALLASGLLLTGCGGAAAGQGSAPGGTTADGKGVDGTAGAGSPGGSVGRSAPEPGTAESRTPEPRSTEAKVIPGLGPKTLAAIPPETNQAVVATGVGKDRNTGTVRVYERDPVAGWVPAGDEWPSHNAKRGWTDDHVRGDLRTPIGVYGLTDAGGLLPDPGTRLPYDRGPAFSISGTGFQGDSLAGSFDYVVAINYNRVPGNTPLDWTRPLGADKGGGIWLHVDHGGPTQGCVSLPRGRMKELLRLLDPKKKPVVVMGDAESLKR